MIIKSSFKPAWWLQNSHLQTVWPSLSMKLRKIQLNLKREHIELPDGDFLEIDWVGKETGPIVFVLHGLDGSSNSPYIQGILNKIQNYGWRGVCMNFRGCSGKPNRYPKTYHAAYTDDLSYLINHISSREKNTPIAIVGYSLGGSILLNWLAKEGKNAQIEKAIAVSVPLDLHKVEEKVSKGFSRIYQWWFLNGLKNKLMEKFKAAIIDKNQLSIELSKILKLNTCRDWDENVTVPIFGFQSVDDYYKKTSPKFNLAKIQKPTIVLQSEDDPLISSEAIPREEEISSSVILEISGKGGHVGFISGTTPFKPIYWLEERIIELLKPVFT